MKRVHTVSAVKSATAGVKGKLNNLKNELSSNEAEALAELLELADDQARELSADELATVAAGLSAKPMSVHSVG